MSALDSKEIESPEKLAIPEIKPSWKRYSLISLWFTIAGAVPLLLSLNAIFSNAVGPNSTDKLGIITLGFWLWLLIALPFSFIVGIVGVSFGGYALKLTKGEQPFKVRAQVVMAIGCLDILTPIGILVFFVLPLFAAAKGH